MKGFATRAGLVGELLNAWGLEICIRQKNINHGQEKGLRDWKSETVKCIYCIQLPLKCEHENDRYYLLGTLISPLGGENWIWKCCGSQSHSSKGLLVEE